LEQVIVRPGGLRNQLDARQLKICSTCFDIAVGLLRVIEMIICVCPRVFIAGVTQHSELLLHRLLQVGCFPASFYTETSLSSMLFYAIIKLTLLLGIVLLFGIVICNVTFSGVLSKQCESLLMQMLTQVLNRICHPANTFNRIVVLRLPGELPLLFL